MLSSLPQAVSKEARDHGTNLFSQYVTLANQEAGLRGDSTEMGRNPGAPRTKSSLVGLLPKRRLEWAGEDVVSAVNNKLWDNESTNLSALVAARRNNRYRLQQCPERTEDESDDDSPADHRPRELCSE